MWLKARVRTSSLLRVSTSALAMNPVAPTGIEPKVAGLRVRPVLPLVLFALLVLSAGLALWTQRAPDAPPLVSAAAPWLFLGFAAGFAVYRAALVAAGRYSAFKAFVQIAFAASFFLLLRLPALHEVVGPPAAGRLLEAALEARDFRQRALAAELVGWRGERVLGSRVVRLLEDPSADVRGPAHEALVRLNGGVDLGPAEQPAARERWKERFP